VVGPEEAFRIEKELFQPVLGAGLYDSDDEEDCFWIYVGGGVSIVLMFQLNDAKH